MDFYYIDEITSFTEEDYQRIRAAIEKRRAAYRVSMQQHIGTLYGDVHHAFPRFFQPATPPYEVDLGGASGGNQ